MFLKKLMVVHLLNSYHLYYHQLYIYNYYILLYFYYMVLNYDLILNIQYHFRPYWVLHAAWSNNTVNGPHFLCSAGNPFFTVSTWYYHGVFVLRISGWEISDLYFLRFAIHAQEVSVVQLTWRKASDRPRVTVSVYCVTRLTSSKRNDN